ncbi:MAG: histidine kinase [Dysgonomonas sp.]|nr:histidine kinase [Dysgonomonas sp.]
MNNTTFDIKKGIPPIMHILFCAAILFIPLLVMSRNGMTEYRYYTGYAARTGTLIFLFYINYLLLIDKFLFKKQFIPYVIINLILIAGITLLQNLVFELLLSPPPPHIRKPKEGMGVPPREMRLLSDYVLIILAIGMSVALKVTRRWYTDSINLESVKAAQLEADLKNLRSQLNPHFLFNTLNNIYSLIAIDTNKAQESVHRLSNLLRYILYENEHKFVPIDKEIQFTQNYIDLMRLRLSPNIELNVMIKNENCDKKIASLLFITLIENAFKHGINNGDGSFIDIKIFVDNAKGALCTVENSLNESDENMESKSSGIGLANLRKRLELLYPNNHELRIEKREKSFFVLLCINFDNEIEE